MNNAINVLEGIATEVISWTVLAAVACVCIPLINAVVCSEAGNKVIGLFFGC